MEKSSCVENVSREMGHLFAALSSPFRLRIIAELRHGELDVNSLCERIGGTHSHMSQHLAVLRHQYLVEERRQGRHVHYQLTQPSLVEWIREGMRYLESEIGLMEELHEAVDKARRIWRRPARNSRSRYARR
jgi:DNA-binding transcriptional ArsR family regulator